MEKALLGKSKRGRKSLVLEGYTGTCWIKEGDWACVPSQKVGKGKVTEPELYNLKKDVGQKNNVAVKYPERVKAMSAKLKEVTREEEE